MNFLAHFYLSGDKESILLGNFLGDFVKGNPFKHYPSQLAVAIQLHRQIDIFTDSHPMVKKSIALLKPSCRRYAGVATDMLYDHLLAKHWARFSKQSLSDFSSKTYATLNTHFSVLPEAAQLTLHYMVKYNWLESYASAEGIHKALSNLERRIGFRAPLAEATEILRQYPEQFEHHFFTFLPEVEQFTQQFIQENLS